MKQEAAETSQYRSGQSSTTSSYRTSSGRMQVADKFEQLSQTTTSAASRSQMAENDIYVGDDDETASVSTFNGMSTASVSTAHGQSEEWYPVQKVDQKPFEGGRGAWAKPLVLNNRDRDDASEVSSSTSLESKSKVSSMGRSMGRGRGFVRY